MTIGGSGLEPLGTPSAIAINRAEDYCGSAVSTLATYI